MVCIYCRLIHVDKISVAIKPGLLMGFRKTLS